MQETMGFIFGSMGITFVAAAMSKIASLRKEFDDLKKKLKDSGVLKEQTESEDKQNLLIAKQTVATKQDRVFQMVFQYIGLNFKRNGIMLIYIFPYVTSPLTSISFFLCFIDTVYRQC